jgi:hypothetical protein
MVIVLTWYHGFIARVNFTSLYKLLMIFTRVAGRIYE